MRAKWDGQPGGYRPICMWLKDAHADYPENEVFETAKQARRALKEAATVAVIGGFRGRAVE